MASPLHGCPRKSLEDSINNSDTVYWRDLTLGQTVLKSGDHYYLEGGRRVGWKPEERNEAVAQLARLTAESGESSTAPTQPVAPVQTPPHQQAYPPPGYAPPPPVTYPVPTGQRTNGMAIASLVLGIIWVYWVGSVLALIFGYIGKSQIENSGGAQGGRGLAIAGIVLGWVGVGVLILLLIIAAAGSG